MIRLLDKLDTWGHKLKLPKFIRYRLCNAFDRALMKDDVF